MSRMKRIDALGKMHPERLAVLCGAVLDDDLDAPLQALVAEAARELGLPSALVSLVLDRSQFFRAHVGLPVDLALARTSDRDTSFCQFVVRDGARFEVTNASADDRVPQELVERYGVESYLGEPISIDGAVVGSLCAMGNVPRTFSDEDRATMVRLAAKVSARLTELSLRTRVTSRALVVHAAGPAFGEARNILAALTANARMARIAAVEAGPLARMVHAVARSGAEEVAALATLGGAADAVDSFRDLSADIDESAQRLVATLGALQSLLGEGPKRVLVAELLDLASHLAHHGTKLVGGVSWAPVPPQMRVSTPRMVAVSTVAAALGALAGAMESGQGGIRGSVRAAPGEVVVELRAEGVDGALMARCLTELADLVDDDPHVALSLADGDGLAIGLAAAMESSS